jgi:hypothetical protein
MTTFTTLDDPSATSSTQAWGINDSGSIVGTFDSSSAFLLSGGTYTTLTPPGGYTGITARQFQLQRGQRKRRTRLSNLQRQLQHNHWPKWVRGCDEYQ